MIGKYTQFKLFSNYSDNKNCTISYLINLISDRAKFAVSGPTFFIPAKIYAEGRQYMSPQGGGAPYIIAPIQILAAHFVALYLFHG